MRGWGTWSPDSGAAWRGNEAGEEWVGGEHPGSRREEACVRRESQVTTSGGGRVSAARSVVPQFSVSQT